MRFGSRLKEIMESNVNHDDDHSNCLFQICLLHGKRTKIVGPASIQIRTFSVATAQLDCNVLKGLLLIYFLIHHRSVKRYKVIFYISICLKHFDGPMQSELHLKKEKSQKLHLNDNLIAQSTSLIIIFFILDEHATQREGEECGSCLNPDKNFFCGNCSVGLECVKGPVIDILLDAPSRCKKIQGNDIIFYVNYQNGKTVR